MQFCEKIYWVDLEMQYTAAYIVPVSIVNFRVILLAFYEVIISQIKFWIVANEEEGRWKTGEETDWRKEDRHLGLIV
jgi:hypothetical protein